MGYPTGQVLLERERFGQAQAVLRSDLGTIVWGGALFNVFVVLTGGWKIRRLAAPHLFIHADCMAIPAVQFSGRGGWFRPLRDPAPCLTLYGPRTGLAFFAASVWGGLLAESQSSFLWTVGSQTFVNYHVVIVVSAGLRVASVGLPCPVTEPSERKVPMMVQLMGYALLKRLSPGRQIMPEAAEDKGNPKHHEMGWRDRL